MGALESLDVFAKKPCWVAVAFGGATLFADDRLSVDQPLSVAWAAGLFSFVAGEATEAEEAADFGAGGVHLDGGLLCGEPAVSVCGHGGGSFGVSQR